MRTLAALICAFALSVAYCRTPPKTKPFTLTISAKPDQIMSGTPVEVTILTKNISQPELVCSVNKFWYEVWDASGKQLLPKKPQKYSSTRSDPCDLSPGGLATLVDDAIFNTMYDLTTPGRYTIQVSLPVSDKDPKSPRIYSNKITVTVTP
jgi:hypothetical protein